MQRAMDITETTFRRLLQFIKPGVMEYEIEAEISGKIVKILVDDMSPVEFDQPLFLVDPS
jgi:Xaa-Pro aminopeptidase